MCAAVAWLGAPAVASASTGWGPPTQINNNSGVNSVSCPTSSFCVALGGQPVTDALIFQNGSWGSPSTIDSNALTSVSCSSESYCVAVDSAGNEVTYDNGTWSAPAAIDSGGMGISSVSCPASTTVPAPFCAAVDLSGNALIDQGGTWGTPTPVGSSVLWVSVACASASFCMTVGLGESGISLIGAAASYDGTSWGTPTTVVSGESFLDSVSCPSSSFCAAVGEGFGGPAGIEGLGFSWNGSTWSSAEDLVPSDTPGSFDSGSISCPSASFCQAVFSSADAAMFNGSLWSVDSGIDTKANLQGVSCPTQAFCEAVDSGGNALTYTGVLPIPTNAAPPTISGSAVVGRTLTDEHGSWTNTPIKSYTYQWEDCDPGGDTCVPISNNAMNRTYTVQLSDVGHSIRVEESATNSGGTSLPAASALTTVAVPPVPKHTSSPKISGNAIVGKTLSESQGTWTSLTPITYSYLWEICDSSGATCTAIPDATDQTFTLTAADIGHTLRVQETATNAGGSSSPATSSYTAMVKPAVPPAVKASNSSPPVISGTAVVGQTLSTTTGAWSETSPISCSYLWQRCNPACSDIGGATGTSYALTSADQGALILVVVTAHNPAGSVQAISSMVGPVTAAAPLGPTSAETRAALLAILGAHGKNAGIKSLLKHGGYSVTFAAPSAGSLVISWYEVPKGARLAKSKKPVLVASAHATFQNAGKATVKIKLTGKGRSLLKHSKHLKLTAKSSFTPSGGSSTSATKSFSIKR